MPGVHRVTISQLKYLQQQPVMDIKEWRIYVDGSSKATINGLKAERVSHPHLSVVVIGLCRDNEEAIIINITALDTGAFATTAARPNGCGQ